jgi:formate hydrogenlyase subunit 3/multisubunit Na+/H+ antiporter MnhD subunit
VHPGLRVCGVLLLLLPVLLLAWQGTSRLADPGPTDASHERTGRALLPVLSAVPGLDIAIRLRALPEPDPRLLQLDIATLVGAGIVMMLLAVALLPGRARLADRLSLAVAVQVGAALVGIGVGDTGGLVAALMILFFLALAVPVALLPAGPGLASWVRRLAVLALAGLPPFGPFAAIFLLLLRVFGNVPLLALLVLAACVAVALSLLPALRQPDTDGTAVRVMSVALLPAVVALVLLGWLGLAMPDRVSDWLLDLSETAAGTAWPVSGPVSGPNR